MTNYLARKKAALASSMKENKGFSLIELIIVVAIMAVLVGVLAPNLLRYIESSREGTDITAMNQVASAFKTAVATAEGVSDGDTLTVTVVGGTATPESTGNPDITNSVISTVGATFKLAAAKNQDVVLTFTYHTSVNSSTGVTESSVTLNNADWAAALNLETT